MSSTSLKRALLLAMALETSAFVPGGLARRTMALRAETAAFGDVLEQAGAGASVTKATELLEGMQEPSRKQEAYRFSKLPDLFKGGGFTLASTPTLDADAKKQVQDILDGAPVGHRIVTVDGVWNEELSDVSGAVATVGNEATADEEQQALLSVISELEATPQKTQGTAPLMALSLATAADATMVRVGAGEEEQTPLYVLNVLTSQGGDRRLSSPRLVVVLEDGARLRLVEHFVSVGSEAGTGSLVNAVGKVVLQGQACMEHMVLQEMAPTDSLVTSVNVTVGDEAIYNATAVNFGGRAARVNLQVDLDGVGGRGEAVGVQITGPEQTHETYVSIIHNGEDCVSDEQQRNVVAKGGEAVFKGRIHIGRYAAGTDSNQLVKTLLLEDGARITALPSLEVINENVEAAHGATVADLDEESIFYLRSRGLDILQARRVLMKGFVDEFLQRIEVKGAADRMQAKLEDMAPKNKRAAESFFQSV